MKRSQTHGFTVMELLVCICIIAILAGVLMPVWKSASAGSKKTACVNNLRQISTAFISYRNEHQQFFPGQGASSDSTARWMQKVSPYLDIPDSTMTNNIAYYKSIFYCPLVPATVYRPTSTKSGCGVYGAPRTIVLLGSELGISYFQIKNPSTKVLLSDKSYLSYKGQGGAGPGLDITAPFPDNADGAAANHRPDGNPAAGPNGGGNYLFADGHVETLTTWPGANAFNPAY